MNDGTVVRGAKGPEAQYGIDGVAKTITAKVPDGKTTGDVEAMIHSHPTKAEIVGEKIYSGNALEPGPLDPTAFANYGTNIIVGPLGQATVNSSLNSMTGAVENTINSKPNGIVI